MVARPGLVWVLGGRDGSTVLDTAELLLHPGTYTSPDTGAGVRLDRCWLDIISRIVSGVSTQVGVGSPEDATPRHLAPGRAPQHEEAAQAAGRTLRSGHQG